MVADVESQKTPLVDQVEMQALDTDLVDYHLERDNDIALTQLLNGWGLSSVLRPASKKLSNDISTSLHKAAKKGSERCLTVLLARKIPKEDVDAPDQNGNSALMVAVQQAQPKMVSLLLEAGANINTRCEQRRAPLHTLVLALCKLKGPSTEEEQGRLLKIADVLLSDKYLNKIDLELHAPLAGLAAATPLAVAATKLSEDGAPEGTSLRKMCTKLVQAGACLTEKAGSGTVEEVLTRMGILTAELKQERRQPPSRRPTAAHLVDVISLGGGSDEVRKLLHGRSPEETAEAACSRLGQYTLLFCAVKAKNKSLVEILLQHEAKPWAEEVTGELPLHRAAAEGHVEIFNLLIDKMRDRNKRLDLQDHTTTLLKRLMENYKAKSALPGVNHWKCFQRLLQEDVKMNFNQGWSEQETPLHVVASFNNQDAISEVLHSGAFLGARKTGDKDCGTVLDSVLPTTLERAMDGCIRRYGDAGSDKAENVASKDYTLELDYRFLVPPQPDDSKNEPKNANEMETLMDLCQSKRHRHVIKHPLLQTLLYAKWRKALLFFLLNAAVYPFFCIILTIFAYRLKDLRVLEARAESHRLNGTSDINLQESIESERYVVNIITGVLLSTCLFMLVRKLSQVKSFRKLSSKKVDYWLEWPLIFMPMVLRFSPLSTDVTRHLAAWTMIVAWCEFVLVLGHVPSLAFYITILRHVSCNFLKFTSLFGAFILAFSISFNIILQNTGDDQEDDFISFWTTIPKVIVMSTGEFEYSDLSERFPRSWFQISAVPIFFVFLFIIYLVVMNVMNALAVTDTQQVVDDATMYSLTSRLEFVYLLESLFLNCPCLRSHVGRIQMLTGAEHSPSFRAMINVPKKERLLAGRSYEFKSKLDDNTTESLRVHRLRHLEKTDHQEREDTLKQLQSILQDIAALRPEDLQRISAAVSPEQ